MNTINLGPYTAGEVPEPLTYTFKDADGEPIDISTYNAQFQYKHTGQAAITKDATVDGSSATYVWEEADLAQPGSYEAVFWVGNNANRFASVHFKYRVRRSPGDVPNV